MTDDRGQPARLVRPPEVPADSPVALLWAVEKANAGPNRRFIVRAALIFSMPALLSTAIPYFMHGTLTWTAFIPFGVGMGLMLGFIMIASRVMRRRWRRELREECRVHTLCMQCGYKLSGLRTEADGCTVCPECGAAWRFLSGSNTS